MASRARCWRFAVQQTARREDILRIFDQRATSASFCRHKDKGAVVTVISKGGAKFETAAAWTVGQGTVPEWIADALKSRLTIAPKCVCGLQHGQPGQRLHLPPTRPFQVWQDPANK